MMNQKIYTVLLILILGLGNLLLVGCSGVPSLPTPVPITTTTPRQKEALPTLTKSIVTPTPTPTVSQALPDTAQTATETATNTQAVTPAPMTQVKEENGWVTYRNEVIGYEISAPKHYVIKGGGFFAPGNHLLGPAVPDEEIYNLISKYYGDSLNIWIWGNSPSGQDIPLIGIYAYDIIVKNLGGDVSPGGIGDYQLTSRQETLQIDWHSYPVRFTVENRDNQPVGELAVLYLEKEGVEFMFGYIQPKDDPEAYQTYLKEIWPEIRTIIETYKKIPEKTSLSGTSSINGNRLKNPSPQAIAQALFEQHLMAFQENPLDPQMKLFAYKIDDVEVPAKWQACAERNKAEFIAAITYSVKPAYWPPERWDDDGYLTFDQWVTRKKTSIAVFRSEQDYTMKILDHPICPGF
jgi:hypothetical protein